MNGTQTTSIGGYKITGILGEGGMGKVYIGEHELLGRSAAIKVLLPEYSNDQEVVNRFFKEAKAATAIRHPGIVKVYDFGYQEDGSAYIAMEYMEGEPLDARLQRQGGLPVQQALRLAGQMASALAAAHEHRIVHRDLKPANVFVVSDPQVSGGERVKLLDFGIAKFAQSDDPDAKQTRAGAILGSPQYMAPEQIRGSRDVDARADLYSLGCILFEMVCGRPPFDGGGNGALAVMAAHLDDPPPMPSSLRPDLSREAEALILYLLAKDPAQRYQSAADVGTAIAAILGEQVSFASMPGVTTETSQVERTALSGVALSPAGVPLSDSQILSHATSQIGMQSAGTTTVAPVPGSQVHTQSMRLSTRRGRVIGIAAALVLVAGGSVLALSQMGDKGQAVVDNVVPGAVSTPAEAASEGQKKEEEKPELSVLTYGAARIVTPEGGGEPEMVIDMSPAGLDQGLEKRKWRITSQPKAEVVDMRTKKVIGQTPINIEFFENEIRAQYKLRTYGYEDETRDFSGKKDYDVNVKLARKMKIFIACEPAECKIVNDKGASQGVTPKELLLSRSDQPVSYTLERDGYEDKRIEVVPDGDKKVNVELDKTPVMVTHEIISDPPDCPVFNKNKEEIGRTPLKPPPFSEVKGKVTYSVKCDGYEKKTVRLRGDQDDSKSVKLTKCKKQVRGLKNPYGCD